MARISHKHSGRGNGRNGGRGDSRPPRTPRGLAKGRYGNIPATPVLCRISGAFILTAEARNTLLAIVRAHWPGGARKFHDVDDDFIRRVLTEFRLYYHFEDGVSDYNADDALIAHMKRNWAQWIHETKDRALKEAENMGTTLEHVCPGHFSPEGWASLCSYWKTEEFKASSTRSKEARSKLRVAHTTGSRPFAEFREVLTREYDRPPTRLEMWERSHMKAGTNDYLTPEAAAIAERYIQLTQQSSTQSIEQGEHDDIINWSKAIGGPKKNRLVGMPGVPAHTVLPPNSLSRRGTYAPRGVGGSGPSCSTGSQGLNDTHFQRVVDSVVQRFRDDPELSSPLVPSRARLRELAQEIAHASIDGGISDEFLGLVRDSMVQVAVNIMEDIIRPQNPETSQANDGARADPSGHSENDLGSGD